MANLNKRIESEYAFNLTNHPNEHVNQIEQNLVNIDITEDANSYQKAYKGEILKFQSRLFFDYVIRKNWTDKWVEENYFVKFRYNPYFMLFRMGKTEFYIMKECVIVYRVNFGFPHHSIFTTKFGDMITELKVRILK